MTIAHGAIQAFFAVVAGAFGAHGLQNVLDEYGLKIWQTASFYHLTHAIALVLLGLFERQLGKSLKVAHWSFGMGIVLFSGSLYALALSNVKILGAITPLGGTVFLVGWVAFATYGYRYR